MKVVVALAADINSFPPTISLVKTLLNIGCKVKLICRNAKSIPKVLCGNDNLQIINLQCNLEGNRIQKFLRHLKYLPQIRAVTAKAMDDADILWTATDNTVRDLGPMIYKYKHVMQLMELVKDIRLAPAFPRIFKFRLDSYARSAYKVVVPEYNRAHITKAWWKLDKLPSILPNKPYMGSLSNTALPDNVDKVVQNLKNEKRRIILYQGRFGRDRSLEAFAKAVELLGDEYVLYLMGEANAKSKELCNRFKGIKFIDFIDPPDHLNVTKFAHIGILSYVSKGRIKNYSELNPLFCAPNKLYEYSGFGIPMVGNDIPGLRCVFDKFNIGLCSDDLTPEAIADCIKRVEKNYIQMSQNCKEFFMKTDLEATVKNIIGI